MAGRAPRRRAPGRLVRYPVGCRRGQRAMPELPEVETIRRQLAPHVEGRTIVARPRSSIPAGPGPTRPRAVERAAARRGGRAPGARGQVPGVGAVGRSLPARAPADDRRRCCSTRPPSRRTRGCCFELDDGHRLVYVDPRRFGTGHLRPRRRRPRRVSARAARDRADHPRVHRRASARRWRGAAPAPVKAFVLDQRRIAGVGNIYADEALFRAGIHPLRPAGRLTQGRLGAASGRGSRRRCSAGIDAKGASIDDFRHVDGARGSFQDRFLVHLRAGRAVPALRHDDPQARRRRPRHLRVRALPAAPAGPPRRADACRGAPSPPKPRSSSLQAARRCRRPAARSKPPIGSLADHDLGEREHPGPLAAARRDRPGPVPD